jgi:hypothetical protein
MSLTIISHPWPHEMAPGHIFIWVNPDNKSTLYSIVLPTEPKALKAGFRLTQTFGGDWPQGAVIYVRENIATTLLSQEQWEIARQLGWPRDEKTVEQIFATPPS